MQKVCKMGIDSKPVMEAEKDATNENLMSTSKRAAYEAFLRSKMITAPERGISIDASAINPLLKPHQAAIVRWALRKGNAAIFAAFGLGKTFMQLEIARLIQREAGGKFLIVAPLGVRQEFARDAQKLDIQIQFVRRFEECETDGIFLTNYETIRDAKMDPRKFTGCSLDEAAILRGFGGTKTFREFMRVFENGQVRYKFVATATPSPNEYIELLAYAAFLDVMDVSQAKTRFFKRDSTKADNLTLHKHKAREFWLWQNLFDFLAESSGHGLRWLRVRPARVDRPMARTAERSRKRWPRNQRARKIAQPNPRSA